MSITLIIHDLHPMHIVEELVLFTITRVYNNFHKRRNHGCIYTKGLHMQ